MLCFFCYNFMYWINLSHQAKMIVSLPEVTLQTHVKKTRSIVKTYTVIFISIVKFCCESSWPTLSIEHPRAKLVHEIKKVQKSRDILPLNCAVRAAPARAAPVLPPNSFHMQTLKRNTHPQHGFSYMYALRGLHLWAFPSFSFLTFVSVPAIFSHTSICARVTIECRACGVWP
jgi:hypothetical protein